MRLKNEVGNKYGRLLVIERADNITSGSQARRAWKVKCDCGTIKVVKAQALRTTKSCGCLRRELAVERNIKHGNYYSECANMYYAAKQRAKRKGLPFSIEISDIIIPKLCPLLAIPLVKGKKGFNPCSPSLDRIIPELGYTKENIWVISMRANTIKQNASLLELELLVNNLKKSIN